MSLPDEAQREQIRTQLESNMIVESPAGSGKTHSLCARMVAGIASGRYQVEQMVGVTFTRKAAAELRGRLQLALEAEPSGPHIERALVNLDRMFMGTIHSFCARLLRESPVEVGVSPGFQECDEALDEALRHHQFRRALEEPDGVELLGKLSDSWIPAEELHDALGTLCDNGEVEFPAPSVEMPDLEPAWIEVDLFARTLEEMLPRPVDPQTTCAIQQKASTFLVRWHSADRTRLFSLLQLLRDWERTPAMVQKYWASTRAEKLAVKARLEELIEGFQRRAVGPFLEQWRASLYGSIIAFLTRVRSEYAFERRRHGRLNYNDLLTMAAELLRADPSVRERLQTKFRWLFVDEFQDTDPVQAEVLFLLAAAPGQGDLDWTQVALRPGSLFIVGDPKQSIYRFRRADIETYTLVQKRMDERVTLSASFRTVPTLCEWTNGVFSRLLPPEANERQAAFSPLVSTRAGDGRVATFTETCYRYQDAAGCEAVRIADWILAARDYRWGDFMILTFKRDDLSLYANALEERGIAVEVTGGRARSLELAEALLELLGVLGDPYDQVGLVGVLRGPLFGLDDDRLFRHREAGGAFTWWTGSGEPAVNDALARLQAMRHWVTVLPVGAAVEKILEETGLIALAASHPGGQAEAAELMLVADQVRQLGLEGLTLPDALREVELRQSVQPPSLACGPSNVVRVMNVHQCKGLEARVVFLASPTGGSAVRASHRVVRSGGKASGFLSLRSRYQQTFAQPVDWPQHEAAELEFLREERTRLLYVAATRARDMLVVGRWAGTHGAAQRPWVALDAFLGSDELAALPTVEGDLRVGAPSQAALEAARSGWKTAREVARQPSWGRISVLASNEEENGTLRAWAPPVPAFLEAGERPDAAAIWGDLIHRLLEHLARNPSLDRAGLERLAHWFLFETPELGEFVSPALDVLDHMRTTEFWRHALGASRRLVEVPFAVRVENRYVYGILDLALRTAAGWEVVDYKTGNRPLRKLIQSYAPQVQSYARHWASLAQEPVAFAGIFGVTEGKLSDNLGNKPGFTRSL